jgi:hypothetical protein
MSFRTATAIFVPAGDTDIRVVLMEHGDDGDSIIEISQIDTQEPRAGAITELTRFIEGFSADFDISFSAHWEASLGRAQLTRSKISKIIDAYPGADACANACVLPTAA